MSELRSFPRKRIQGDVKVYEQGTGVRLGLLHNITVVGMMVLMEKSIDPGDVIKVRIMCPTGDDDLLIDFETRCIWTESAVESGKYWSGFKIIKIGAECLQNLDNWIVEA